MKNIEELSSFLLSVESGVIRSIVDSKNLEELEALRVKCFGRNGIFKPYFQDLKEVSDKETLGNIINSVKSNIEKNIEEKRFSLCRISDTQLEKEAIDITLSGRGHRIGSLHPITQTRENIEELFKGMGFIIFDSINDSPEIEDEWHNFTALNMSKNHPARMASDTFYLKNCDFLLRTQTSPAQIRAMEFFLKPPLQIIATGKVYRRDFDVTHTPMFHQLEGLVVSEDASFSQLKFILCNFFSAFFDKKLDVRFRPSYFPFTEPSAEVDLTCFICDGCGCNVCKNGGWIEMGGSGMVHPNVLKSVNFDSEKYTGFAFGIGIERLAMFKYRINDIRVLFENDIRFLEQF